ncbi:MAG: YjdF family protein [Butyrivibrio sp.]|nr:YjdF family protein [Butyrivibrio sp.]
MDKQFCNLTVFFEEPFWVGVFEITSAGKMAVCKVTFGAEPKDYEIYDFVLQHFNSMHFSTTVAVAPPKISANPKRLQREIRKSLQNTGIGTKSQQALQLQHEESKKTQQAKTRLEKETKQLLLFHLHQQKKKEKKKGH